MNSQGCWWKVGVSVGVRRETEEWGEEERVSKREVRRVEVVECKVYLLADVLKISLINRQISIESSYLTSV